MKATGNVPSLKFAASPSRLFSSNTLLDTLESTNESVSIQEAWDAEAARRIEDLKAGKAVAVPSAGGASPAASFDPSTECQAKREIGLEKPKPPDSH